MGQLIFFKAVCPKQMTKFMIFPFLFSSFFERDEIVGKGVVPPNPIGLQGGPVLLTDDIHSGSWHNESKTLSY